MGLCCGASGFILGGYADLILFTSSPIQQIPFYAQENVYLQDPVQRSKAAARKRTPDSHPTLQFQAHTAPQPLWGGQRGINTERLFEGWNKSSPPCLGANRRKRTFT